MAIRSVQSEPFKTTFSAESGHEAIHQRTTLTALYPVVPRGPVGIEIFYVRNFSRAFITDLMASLTPLFWVLIHSAWVFICGSMPLPLGPNTWKFMRAWKVDNRQPVIRWVDRGCFLWCCRDNGGQINCLVRAAFSQVSNQPIRNREPIGHTFLSGALGKHILAIVVSDYNFAIDLSQDHLFQQTPRPRLLGRCCLGTVPRITQCCPPAAPTSTTAGISQRTSAAIPDASVSLIIVLVIISFVIVLPFLHRGHEGGRPFPARPFPYLLQKHLQRSLEASNLGYSAR
ncbi:MAG: hypothetical protein Ct9H300mP25_17360 [Acidobacteriota bacterium]|nr:MAG: hypothetical protein Ct9H300mP25_17360 [Acidobacteriota bacterium]